MPRQKKQHLKRRKDGRYCCVYHGIQFMGNTEEEALEKRKAYQLEEQREGYVRENPTVAQYSERWLDSHKVGLRRMTIVLKELHLEKLKSVLGDLYMKEVRPSDIKEVFTQKYVGVSDSYIGHGKSMFAAIFASAVEDGLIPTNPVTASSAKPHKGHTGSHRAITPEERRLIETVATDHRMHTSAIVMLYAGLRPQEVKALQIDKDVDFEKGIIHVQSFVHVSSDKSNCYEIDSEGKTKNAARDVPLFLPVRKVLEGKKGYLLYNRDGSMATRAGWQRAWGTYARSIENHLNGTTIRRYRRKQKALKQGETLPPWKTFDVVPYHLRHSFATWLRDQGVELHTCVAWMGHADAKMILKIYDEVTDTRSQKEAERIEKMLIHMQNDMQKKLETPETVENKAI